MRQKISQRFLEKYDVVILTQPLAHGKYIKQKYHKADNIWAITYESNSIYHICPYDGIFRNCVDCGALDEDFDIEFCLNKIESISSGALIERIYKCQDAGLQVDFLYKEDILEE